MRILTKIERRDDSYLGVVTTDGGRQRLATGLELAPSTQLEIGGERTTLGELQEGLALYDRRLLGTFFDERGQLELGRHLYTQLFGRAGFSVPALEQPGAEVRIEADDEEILRLPWVLLADDEGFLSQRGWSVSLCGGPPCGSYHLPPMPRLLIAMPQPRKQSPTRAEDHLARLRAQVLRIYLFLKNSFLIYNHSKQQRY